MLAFHSSRLVLLGSVLLSVMLVGGAVAYAQSSGSPKVLYQFEDKIVYEMTQSPDVAAMRAHCGLWSGTLNECGTMCPTGQTCPAVCAYTCELPNDPNADDDQQFDDITVIDTDTDQSASNFDPSLNYDPSVFEGREEELDDPMDVIHSLRAQYRTVFDQVAVGGGGTAVRDLERMRKELIDFTEVMRAQYDAVERGYLQVRNAPQSGGNVQLAESLHHQYRAVRSNRFSDPCHRIDSDSLVSDGFGAPWNPHSSARELLVRVNCDGFTDEVALDVGLEGSDQLIYRYGYVYRNNAWEVINLLPNAEQLGEWFVGSARANVKLTAHELVNGANIVAYMCSKVNNQWRCGCADSACATPMWQLQRVRPQPEVGYLMGL